MAVEPTELNIIKGQSATATISGGSSGNYTAMTMATGITLSVEGNTLTVSTAYNSESTATVTIFDNLETVNLTVHVYTVPPSES